MSKGDPRHKASSIRSSPVPVPLRGNGAAPGVSRIRSAPSRQPGPAGAAQTVPAEPGGTFRIPSARPAPGPASEIGSAPAPSPGIASVPSRSAAPAADRPRARAADGVRPSVPDAPSDAADHVVVVGRFRPGPRGRVPDETHLADALAAAGAAVHRVDELSPAPPLPAGGWALFTARPSSWLRMPELAAGRRTVLWTLDLLADVPERLPAAEAAGRADILATPDKSDWTGRGVRSHLHLPGACDPFATEFDPRPERKCAFIGALYSRRRAEISGIVRGLGGQVVEPSSWMDAARLAKFVQGTKVVVGDNMRNDLDGYWSARNYVVPGAGGFLLAPQCPGMRPGLEPGRHFAVWGETGGLAREIERWAAADDERERIRREGFLHVRSTHTWAARAATLLSAMRAAPLRRR